MGKGESSMVIGKRHYLLEGGWRKKCAIPVIPVEKVLNPFYDDGFDLHVALANQLPCGTIKFITILGLLDAALDKKLLEGTMEIVEATSGGAGDILARFAPHHPYNVQRVTCITNSDIPLAKRVALELMGARIKHPDPGNINETTIDIARREGGGGYQLNGTWKRSSSAFRLNLDQYSNPFGCDIHAEVTGPEIEKSLREFDVLVLGVGTGGTLVGLSKYFKARLPNLTVVGVLCAPNEEIPGVRELEKMKQIQNPWREACDHTIEVARGPAYLAATWFHRSMHVPAGASSGFGFAGGIKFLKRWKDANRLDELRRRSYRHDDSSTRSRVLFLFPDNSYLYPDRFEANVPFSSKQLLVPPFPWDAIWRDR